jgi:hypothetical protein
MRTSSVPFIVGVALIVSACLPVHADEMTRRVQEELRRRQIFFGDIDGRDGAELAQALRLYQKRKGLPVSGLPDPSTLTALSLPADSADARKIAAELLPDIPVLRSDVARDVSLADRDFLQKLETAETPVPIAEGPAEEQEAPSKEQPATIPENLAAAEHLVREYLAAAEKEEPTEELAFYAERVDYFDHGVVPRQFVEKDVRRYYKRWPARKFTLLSMTSEPHPTSGEVVVKFRIRFDLKSPRESARGETENTFRVGEGTENTKLVSLRERRVRR